MKDRTSNLIQIVFKNFPEKNGLDYSAKYSLVNLRSIIPEEKYRDIISFRIIKD